MDLIDISLPAPMNIPSSNHVPFQFKNENILGLIAKTLPPEDWIDKNIKNSFPYNLLKDSYCGKKKTERIRQLPTFKGSANHAPPYTTDHPHHRLIASIKRLRTDYQTEPLLAAAARLDALPEKQWHQGFTQIHNVARNLPPEQIEAMLPKLRTLFFLNRGVNEISKRTMEIPKQFRSRDFEPDPLESFNDMLEVIQGIPLEDRKSFLSILATWSYGFESAEEMPAFFSVLNAIEALREPDRVTPLRSLIVKRLPTLYRYEEAFKETMEAVLRRPDHDRKVLLPHLAEVLPKWSKPASKDLFYQILRYIEALPSDREDSLYSLIGVLPSLQVDDREGAFKKLLIDISKELPQSQAALLGRLSNQLPTGDDWASYAFREILDAVKNLPQPFRETSLTELAKQLNK